MAKKKVEIKWLGEPEDHSYPAAKSYLNMLYKEPMANSCVEKLKSDTVTEFKAKDLFRATDL